MSNIAVQVQGIGKEYALGERGSSYKTLRESVTNIAANTFHKVRSSIARSEKEKPETSLWALKDVSFDIRHGEVVGLIGRNGAGKSTLLKILSRVTLPTAGRIALHGRVGALLEVGTGFHPELTGRENVFLSGAILGMRRAEIRRKFDEIVAFAEIEKFLDTPTKRYSSGMYMRLAFAVAAHLDPEILVVDEVLAVGDSAFQQKCLGKMSGIANEGRTVLFVSHNMAAVTKLCSRGIILRGGGVTFDSTATAAVQEYLKHVAVSSAIRTSERRDRKGNGALKFTDVQIRDASNGIIERPHSGQDITLCLKYESADSQPLRNVQVAIGMHGRFDENLFHMDTNLTAGDLREIPPEGEIRCSIPHLPLQPGIYPFNVFCKVGGEVADWLQPLGMLEVEAGDFFDSGRLPSQQSGPILVSHAWNVTPHVTTALAAEVS